MTISSQQQLMALLQHKLSQNIEAETGSLSVLDKETRLSMLKALEVSAEDMGKISLALGLKGFSRACGCLRSNFQLLSMQKSAFSVNVNALLSSWSVPLSGYFHSMGHETEERVAVDVVLDFLRDEAWPLALDDDAAADLKQVFAESFSVSDTQAPNSPVVITEEMASLRIPSDVDVSIVGDFLSELSYQAEAFDCAIEQYLITEDEVQLRVAQRISHTIKGAANAVGVRGLSYLMHYVEDVLETAFSVVDLDPNLGFILQDTADCLSVIAEFLNGLGPRPEGVAVVVQSVLDYVNNQANVSKEPGAAKIDGVRNITVSKEFQLESLIAFNDPGLKTAPPIFQPELVKPLTQKTSIPDSSECELEDGRLLKGEINTQPELAVFLDGPFSGPQSELTFEKYENLESGASFDAMMVDLTNVQLNEESNELPHDTEAWSAAEGASADGTADYATANPTVVNQKHLELTDLSRQSQRGNAQVLSSIEALLSEVEPSNQGANDYTLSSVKLNDLLSLRQLLLSQSQIGLSMQHALKELSVLSTEASCGVPSTPELATQEVSKVEPSGSLLNHVLVVRVGQSSVCLLSEPLEGVLYVEPAYLKATDGGCFYQQPGKRQSIRVYKLNDLVSPRAGGAAVNYSTLVLTRNPEGGQCGVLVESIVCSERLSVRPLSDAARKAPGVVGSVVFDDDSASSVVDVQQLPIF